MASSMPHLYLQFTYIEPKSENHCSRDGGPSGCWKPPTRYDNFDITNVSPIYLWSAGSLAIAPATAAERIQVFRVSSMFWCTECQGYLHFGDDCTKKNVPDGPSKNHVWEGWQLLRFENKEDEDGGCLSLVGHLRDGHPHNTIGAPEPTGLIPGLFPPRNRYIGPINGSGYQGTCKIAGDLSILFGLMAFSGPRNEVQLVISKGFKLGGRWTPLTERPDIPNNKKGIVVQVGYDMRQPHGEKIWKEQEDGEHGGIIT